MCLGVPGRVVELQSDDVVRVDFWGATKLVRLESPRLPVATGDYIIEHAGAVVRVIPPADVADTLALYEVLLTEAGEDPIARDVADGLLCLEIEPEAPALA